MGRTNSPSPLTACSSHRSGPNSARARSTVSLMGSATSHTMAQVGRPNIGQMSDLSVCGLTLGMVGGAHVGVEPLEERLGRPQQTDDALLGLGRAQPGACRPVLPVDEALVAQQFDARVVLRVALGRRLEDVVGADLDAVGGGLVYEAHEGLAGALVGDRGPESLQLVGHEPVVAGPGAQPS